mgnify:CR=1 FL=1
MTSKKGNRKIIYKRGMYNMFKKFLSVVLSALMIVSMGFTTTVFANDDIHQGEDMQIVAAYRSLMAYAQENNIPLDMSFETFIQEYESGNYVDVDEYISVYHNILNVPENTLIAPYSSGSSKWYYNTGTSLPQAADYSEYRLLDVVKKGDLIFEAKGGFGITGHIAIVEGIYYSSAHNQSYIRIVEAIDKGVVRSVLDDERVNDKDVTILRVSDATSSQINSAVSFCIGQLGKAYKLDFAKDISPNEKDWYCSELVWAAYYNQGIDIETSSGINEPGVTPRDIRNSNKTSVVSFK